MSESLSSALKEVDLNSKKISNKEEEDVEAKKETSSTSSDPTACSSCSLANATKRCSKRHAKCLKKLFCDKVCETQVNLDFLGALANWDMVFVEFWEKIID
jgi:hypothetical protein